MRTLLVIAAVGLVTACSSAQEPSTPNTTTSAAGAGKCADVVKEFAKVTDTLIDKGCTDQNGSARLGKTTACKNGQRLWEMDGMIGLSGENMVPATKKTDDGIPADLLMRRVCLG